MNSSRFPINILYARFKSRECYMADINLTFINNTAIFPFLVSHAKYRGIVIIENKLVNYI